MITIIFEAHGTTIDNEARRASGHADIELSELGAKQSKEMGERYKDQTFDVIFCSDLQRSYKSAELAFGDKYPVIKDKRLRECDYGEMTQGPSDEVEAEKINRVREPFPGGESYEQCNQRMREFLDELKQKYDGKKVMIIGHRATQYGIESYVNNKPLDELVSAKFTWQPGWTYHIS